MQDLGYLSIDYWGAEYWGHTVETAVINAVTAVTISTPRVGNIRLQGAISAQDVLSLALAQFGNNHIPGVISAQAAHTAQSLLTGNLHVRVQGDISAQDVLSLALDQLGYIRLQGNIPANASLSQAIGLAQVFPTLPGLILPNNVVTRANDLASQIRIIGQIPTHDISTTGRAYVGRVYLTGDLLAQDAHTSLGPISGTLRITAPVIPQQVFTDAIAVNGYITLFGQIQAITGHTIGIPVARWFPQTGDVVPLTAVSIANVLDVIAFFPQVFDQVNVDYSIHGITRISWTLRPRFHQPPHVFQVQRRLSDGLWLNVGEPVTDVLEAFDTSHYPCAGTNRYAQYRVALLVSGSQITSPPATTLGQLSYAQWGVAREIIRRATLPTQQHTIQSLKGVLLRRQAEGIKCTACVDPFTGGVTNSDCQECRGTGFIQGYWVAGEHKLIDLRAPQHQTQQTLEMGTVSKVNAVGRFIGFPLVFTGDVWISADGDLRYEVGRIKRAAAMDGVPLVVDAELSLLPQDASAYNVEYNYAAKARGTQDHRYQRLATGTARVG